MGALAILKENKIIIKEIRKIMIIIIILLLPVKVYNGSWRLAIIN